LSPGAWTNALGNLARVKRWRAITAYNGDAIAKNYQVINKQDKKGREKFRPLNYQKLLAKFSKKERTSCAHLPLSTLSA